MTLSAPFSRIALLFAASFALTWVGTSADAAGRGKNKQDDVVAVDAEFFEAMASEKIAVKFIPHDSSKATVVVRNLTDQPLNIQLPEAFAGVPVLAQGGGMMGGGMGGMGGGMMGGGMGGMGGGMGGGQAMGGGMGGMGGGMGGGMMGGGMGGMGGGMGGMMRVAPEKQAKLNVTCVCLEHGKPEPMPKMKYTIIPLSKFTDDANVQVLCESLGYNQLPQNIAQAVTWHLTDGLTWSDLANKVRIDNQFTADIPYFTAQELQLAQSVLGKVRSVAADRVENHLDSDSSSGGDSESSSRRVDSENGI